MFQALAFWILSYSLYFYLCRTKTAILPEGEHIKTSNVQRRRGSWSPKSHVSFSSSTDADITVAESLMIGGMVHPWFISGTICQSIPLLINIQTRLMNINISLYLIEVTDSIKRNPLLLPESSYCSIFVTAWKLLVLCCKLITFWWIVVVSLNEVFCKVSVCSWQKAFILLFLIWMGVYMLIQSLNFLD